MSKNRDDFSPKVKELLRASVGNRCSKPDCRVPTTAGGADSLKLINIGKAAHICAAASGGPRYDMEMSPEQRKSFENGIWLCGNHADEIDKDEERYTVQLLHQWKREAINKARNELGKKLPDNDDSIHTLTTALTGIPSKKILPNAIRNICKASEKALEDLDPRFNVNVSYRNNVSVFELLATEDVVTKLIIDDKIKDEFNRGFEKLVNHAEEFSIPAGQVKIQGNPILEYVINEVGFDGDFILSKPDVLEDAVFKLWVIDKKTKIIHSLDDIRGGVKIGRKSFSFSGYTFDNLIRVDTRAELHLSNKLTFNFAYDFNKWNGVNVLNAPYFTKSFNFLRCVVSGGEVNASLEVSGEVIMSGKKLDNVSSFISYYFHHKYIMFCREVSKAYKLSIFYDKSVSIDKDDYDVLENYYLIVKGDNTVSYNPSDGKARIVVKVFDGNYDFLKEINAVQAGLITLSQSCEQEISIFGKVFNLPGLAYDLTKVKPQINVRKLKIGSSCTINLIPHKGCKYIVRTIDVNES